jgi:lathosterol oxidase
VLDWLLSVAAATLVSIVTFWGVGGAVHHLFYVRRRARAAEWKLQPERFLTPALDRHARRLGNLNLLLGSIVGGTFVWYLRHGGWSMIYFDWRAYPLLWIPASGLLALVAIDAGLYYSHRLMHHRLLFRHIHRWHHRYVAPTVFTTTAMHPVEFFIFASCLLVPALVIPIHAGVYIAVIGYTYFIGMVDHSGIRARWKLPLHGNNQFHDDHHVYFHCNYGHHTSLWDRLHDTVHHPERYYDEHTYGGQGAPRATESEHVQRRQLPRVP